MFSLMGFRGYSHVPVKANYQSLHLLVFLEGWLSRHLYDFSVGFHTRNDLPARRQSK